MSKAPAGNFVTIKNKQKPNAPGKKALRPPTLAALLKNATRLLGLPDDQPVKCFYDKNGELIESIGDIEAGMEIFASTKPPEQGFESVQNMAPPSPKVMIGGTQNQSRQGPSQLQNVGRGPSQLASLQSRPVSAIGGDGRPASPLMTKPSSRSPSSLMIVVDDKNGMAGIGQRARHKKNEFEMDDEDQFEAPDDDDKRYETTGISHRALERLVAFLPQELVGLGADIANDLTGICARLASSAAKCEAVQDTVVYKYVQDILGEVPVHSTCIDAYVGSIVNDCTFGNSFTSFTKFRHAIVGPTKSGKSTFMHVLTNATLARMFANGQYRKTMVMLMDMRKMKDVLTDPLQFYREIVRITFEHLAAQRIDLIPFCDLLTTYFEKLPTLEKCVPLPNKFVMEDDFRNSVPLLTDVAQRLWQCMHRLHSLSIWMTNVVMFPRYVAQAFGFGNVHFVIDHLDASDVDIIPAEPFDQETQVITLIEHLKFMLSNDSFVVSCEDEEHLLESLDLITDDGVDLRDGTEIISVVDTDSEHSEKFCFSLTVDGEPYPMKLRKIDCGGCPGYLHLWDGLIQQGDRLWNEGMKDQNSRIAKELKLSLLGKIRDLAALIICKVDEEDLSVAPMKKQIKDFELVNTECEEERKSAKGDDEE